MQVSGEQKSGAAGQVTSRAPVLLVEDDEALGMAVARYLQSAGYTVHFVSEREQAEALLTHNTYSLVMTDLALTRVGFAGLSVLEAVNASCNRPKVLVLTGHATPDVAVTVGAIGVDAFVRKPVTLRELGHVVDRLQGVQR